MNYTMVLKHYQSPAVTTIQCGLDEFIAQLLIDYHYTSDKLTDSIDFYYNNMYYKNVYTHKEVFNTIMNLFDDNFVYQFITIGKDKFLYNKNLDENTDGIIFIEKKDIRNMYNYTRLSDARISELEKELRECGTLTMKEYILP